MNIIIDNEKIIGNTNYYVMFKLHFHIIFHISVMNIFMIE